MRWEPPKEIDDEEPILGAGDVVSRLPRVPRVRAPEPQADKRDSDEATRQLFLNVGRREGVKAEDLQKLLSDRGVAPDTLSDIRVRDRMTFMRVRAELFDRAVEALSGQVIGGRTVVAELARGR